MDAQLRDLHAQGVAQDASGEIIGVSNSIVARRQAELGLVPLRPWARMRAGM
jgi:hypothetical protein